MYARNILNDRKIISMLQINAPFRNYASGVRCDPATFGVTASMKF